MSRLLLANLYVALYLVLATTFFVLSFWRLTEADLLGAGSFGVLLVLVYLVDLMLFGSREV